MELDNRTEITCSECGKQDIVINKPSNIVISECYSCLLKKQSLEYYTNYPYKILRDRYKNFEEYYTYVKNANFGLRINCKCSNCNDNFDNIISHENNEIVFPQDLLCNKCKEIIRENKIIEMDKNKRLLMDKQTKDSWLLDIPLRYKDCTIENFKSDINKDAFKLIQNYDIKCEVNKLKSIILYSNSEYGVGKTHLLIALMSKIINEKAECKKMHGEYIIPINLTCYITESDLMVKIRNTYSQNSNQSEYELFSEFGTDLDYLFIDDIGKCTPRDKGFLQSVYFNIIDKRYQNMLPIYLATNLLLDDFEAHIGGASSDRLIEMCGKGNIVKLTGKSKRISK